MLYMLCANHGSVTIHGLHCSKHGSALCATIHGLSAQSVDRATRELSIDLAKPWIARYNHPQIETLVTFHFCAVVSACAHALISVTTCTLRMNW